MFDLINGMKTLLIAAKFLGMWVRSMTEKEKTVIGQRLTELFDGETQSVTANHLHTTQSNISKWVNGQSVPPTEIIYVISKKYHVSVDWILGISDRKNVDCILYEKLTYEQVFRMIDRLLLYRNFVLADLNEVYEDIKRKRKEEETLAGKRASDEKEKEEPRKPEYDSDYIKINDRLLSYLFRRRMNTEATDPDLMELWKENKLPNFGRLRVIDNTGNMEAALDAKGWAIFRDGDWIDNMEELLKMTEEERAKWIEQQRKEGKR